MSKKFKTFGIVAFAVLLVTACKNDANKEQDAQNTEQESKAKTVAKVEFEHQDKAEVFEAYNKIKNSLVKTDAEHTQKIADEFTSHHEEKSDAYSEKIYTLIAKIGHVNDVEEQRDLFKALSEEMESFLKASLKEGKIFKQYCPMAFNNKGAYWFSTEEEIFNPYFGEKMLHCGSVKATIK